MTEKTGSLVPAIAFDADGFGESRGSFPKKSRGGPKTPAGRRRSSLNALRSGLYADAVLIKGEDRDEYLRFARAIVAGLDVQNALEMAMAERVVSSLWRSRRARRYEQAHLNASVEEADEQRKALEQCEERLRDHEREADALAKLATFKTMSADELGDCANAADVVFAKNDKYGGADEPCLWARVPERGRVSREKVRAFVEALRDALEPVAPPSLDTVDLSVVLSWTQVQHFADRSRIEHDLEEARDKYGAAIRRTLILDATEADAYDRELRAGRVLEDAERRLDRQVSRALADLEAARKLRPNRCP